MEKGRERWRERAKQREHEFFFVKIYLSASEYS